MPRDGDIQRQAIIALASLINLNIAVRVRKGLAYLVGAVSSEAEKREAERLVSRVPGIKGVVNQLTVDQSGYYADSHVGDVSETDVMDELSLEAITLGEQEDAEPDFTGDVGPTDVADTEDVVEFFAPTDPVEHNSDRDHEGMEVRGGWAPTSMTEPTDVNLEPRHFERSDYEILDDVIQALRNDASTQDLDIKVSVHNSVVHLHGKVPAMEDAENAEEVASRVDGVLEVVEALEIEEPYIRL
ncbi:MAG: BON domain-containing protein [Chloroflexota bacterium]